MNANTAAKLSEIPVNDSATIDGLVVIHWTKGFEIEFLGREVMSAAAAAAKIDGFAAARRPVATMKPDARFFRGSYEAARAHFGKPVIKMPGTGILSGSVSQWAPR